MDIIVKIIRRKPLFFFLILLIYLAVTGFVKWTIHPTISTLWYAAGGLLGIYFLDIAEEFFHLTPSPFRTVLFSAGFGLVSFFVVTSSGSFLAMGLVMSLYLTLVLWQIGEWQIKGNLNDWYRMVAGPVEVKTQVWVLVGFIALFLIETYFFIR